ncbi:Glu-tRNA(Gln) amidotransferase subunit GatD, partial [archaeon]|nr:Glu-tRNA(Gln) amidotransferase subunit GatD [archaeon]
MHAEVLIKKFGAEYGDEIELLSEKNYTGILMPSHNDIITLKLKNGYNIGVKIDEKSKIKVIKKKQEKTGMLRNIEHLKGKPVISLISTGGTIASYVDYRTGAVHPALTAEELAFSVPELTEKYNVKAKVLFSILSEDMKAGHWRKLAKETAKELNSGADAVVIPHGTDTMAYTSAALSFMLKNLTGPVILVGSQRSSDRPSSDASMNLLSAAKLSETDLGEVVVVMHGETSDTYSLIHRGTRVRKMHTSRRDAFKSVNEKPIGRIDNDVKFFQDYRKKSSDETVVNDKIEEKVALIYFYPGLTPEFFDYAVKNNRGIVIAGTGLGHVSSDLIEIIRNAKIPIIMSSQCLNGRVNMNVYSTGRDLLNANVIPGEDMLPETARVKLMYVLGQTKKTEKVKEMMAENMVGEISP